MRLFLTTIILIALSLLIVNCSTGEQQARESVTSDEYEYSASEAEYREAPTSRSRVTPMPQSPYGPYSLEEPIIKPEGNSSTQQPEEYSSSSGHSPVYSGQENRQLKNEEIQENLLEQLYNAAFGYFVPTQANIDELIEAKLIINPNSTESEITEQLGEASQSGSIEITRVVEARLETHDFYIRNVTPTRQVVFNNSDTVWIWDLRAKEAGSKTVRITIDAILTVEGERVERHIESYTGVINIDVTPKQRILTWVENNWKWAWGAIFVPLGIYLWKRRKKLLEAKP